MKENFTKSLIIITCLVAVNVSFLMAQPVIGITTFDGANVNIAPFGALPRSGTVAGWNFFINGTGSGSINHNGASAPSNVNMFVQATSTINISSNDGSEFNFENYRVQFFSFAGTYTITSYRDGTPIGSVNATASSTYTTVDLSANTNFDNIDEIRLSGFGGSNVTLNVDEILIAAASSPNAAPTASSFTAANGPYENLTYTFSTADFGYSDSDGDVLSHVLIESIPGSGTLYVDADNDDLYDAGEEVSVSDQISKADLDAGNLQYIQNGSTNTSFQFEVNDGTENSTGNYIATLNVSAVPTVTLGISPTSKSEAITTATMVSATLSNAYGVNTIINLGFSGTATNSVDYTTSSSTITVTAGSTTGTIALNNINDAFYESNETVIIDIANVPSGGVENGTQQVTYTITNDDAQPTASLLLRPAYNPIADESGGQAYIIGEISAVAGVTVSIPLLFSGTAMGGGTDYSITGSVITLSPGELRDSIRVTSMFDGIEEGDETVIIDMNPPTNATEDGVQQVTLTITDEDAAPPTGYSVSIDQNPINTGNESAISFTFAGAEVGATYNYTFSSSGGGTNVTGSGTIATATDQISGIDLSGLGDGTITLSVTLTDVFGNTGSPATDTGIKDTTAPTGYTVSIDQAGINLGNENAVSFTFAGAEVGTTYNYTFSSSGGGTNVTGSGTITTATDQITGINLSGLGDGTITLSITLTDAAGNTGSPATDTETKDTTVPSGYSVTIDQSPINSGNQNAVSFTFAGAETGTTYNYTFSSSGGGTNVTGSGTIVTATDQITGINLSGLGDGTITLSVTLTDGGGNTGSPATDTEIKDSTAPSGYSAAIDQSTINQTNETAVSFTFAGAETGATYNYTLSSSGGGTNVTGSGTIVTATDQILGIDLSGLGDGTITLSVTLTDTNSNTGSPATDTKTKDTAAPSGYSVTIDQSPINSGNETAVSFTFAGAETGTTYNYTFSSSGGGTNVAGSGTIVTATDQITGINLSGLGDGTITLSVTLTDAIGNIGSPATDTETKETVPPTGYSVVIDQSPINNANQSAVSFTFTGAEVGATYNYTFSSSGGGTNVTGSGTIATATDQITGINLSGLGDGTITLSVTLTDTNGNTGTPTTDTETKDTSAPVGYSVVIDQSPINNANQSTVSFTFAGAEVGATYNYTFSSSGGGTNVTGSGTIATATDQITGVNLSGLGDGTVTLTITLTDTNGNTGSAATDTETKDTVAPTGYSVVIDQSPINSVNQTAVSYTFSGAEIGATYNYTFSSSGGGTNVTGSGTIATAIDQISGIDLSGLGDGTITLTVTLTDSNGNTGSAATDTETKETVPPTGYSVVIDQSPINTTNQAAISFTFAGAEVGATYNYIFSSSGGGTNVTGSGIIATATDQITGIDLSGLGDGTITLTVTLTDTNGNTGSAATDTETKDTSAPTGYSVAFDQAAANAGNSTAISFTFAGAEVGTTYNYTISSSGGGTNVTGSGTISTATDQITGIDVSGLGDGTLTLSVTLTDNTGNTGVTATDNITKDTGIPSGYAVSIDLLGETIINTVNQTIIEFSATGLEVGTTLNYTFTSDGGGTPVSGTETVTSTSEQFNNSGAGYDLSGLTDGTITLTISLTDGVGNTGSNATTTETKDAGPPSGYSVAWDDILINASEAPTATFTVSGAEIGSTINNTVSSSGDGNTATVSNPTVVSSSTQVVMIDVSSLTDGVLTVQVSLTDGGSNTGSVVSDNSATLDQTAPSGYTVAIDQASINAGNVTTASFTFAGAEVGATYNYTFSSTGGGTNVTGTGIVGSASDQITGIDLSGLGDGTLTLSVTLTDPAGNTGSPATDTVDKDASAPVFISVDDNGGDNSYRSGESLTIVADLGESGLTVTVDLSVINSGLSGTAAMTDNGDGTYSVTIADVDASGNMVEGAAIAVPLTATDASSNQQTDNSLILNLDKTAPAGYTVTIDQADINIGNQNAVSFTFAGAETGATYNFTFSSSGGGTNITGSGTIASASDQVTGIDLSGLPDGTITLSVTLTDVAGNVGAPATDNINKMAASIQFSTSNSTGSESVASASLQIELSVPSAQNVTVDYTVGGTATNNGTDYMLLDGTFTINAGNQSGSINISGIVDDLLIEGDETIVVTLSNPSNAALGAITVHTYTIIDNDAKQPQVITFAAIPDVTLGQGPVQLQATGGDSGEPVTFTITTQPATGVATLSNGTVIIEGVGTVSVTASQDGNDFYEPAEDVTRTFEILPNELFLPTLFSPNNDQSNDRFLLRGGGDITEIKLSIFDREGNLVYSSNSIAELTQSGWDGTNEGTKQPQGAYVWVVRGSFSNGAPILINGKNTGIIRLAR
ncbi:gliding motility-associated C-terminal domain-containing protein [Fulvivirga sp. 29W222]|uniref:Gliding motility-associated C-terminal domain-containing protein n=1 Tax=Fulvivirga marina TaxID=2494733 RepID=A0A937KGN4_9BACT|nr:Calx-beta domain-containing protein [Fulvivirga marina]MBL6449373.1 gliding motility-associated C-terminal domain-containing protein [Fulvivirga marina]